MSFRAFSHLFFVLVGLGVSLLAVLFALAYFSPRAEEGTLAAVASAATFLVGSAFVCNAVAGVVHKKMRGRGGHLITAEESGRWFYWLDLPMNFGLGILALGIGVGLLLGAVPIRL